MQGFRHYMEDAHIGEQLEDGNVVCAVLDGHGGTEVSKWISTEFCRILQETESYKAGDFKKAMYEVNFQVDKELEDDSTVSQLWDLRKHNEDGQSYAGDYWPKAGTTATVVLLTKTHAYYSNCGDSRTIVVRDGKADQMTKDHKPEDPLETERIKKADGKVMDGRVDGFLAVSRALGDLEYKSDDDFPQDAQKVVATPDIVEMPLEGIEYFALACDGVWDHRSNQQIADWFNEKVYQNNFAAKKGKVSTNDMVKACDDLLDDILPKNEDEVKKMKPDNTSVLLLEIRK
jgi:serine/threonine protein phosphatase PrpC